MTDGEKKAATETTPSDLDAADGYVAEKPLKLQMSDLVADARSLALAEVEYFKTKLSVNMAAAKPVLVLFGVALAMGFVAIIAFILGVLLIADHYLGPIAATAIVTGVFLLIAGICAKIGINRARKLPLSEKSDEQAE